MRGPEPPEPITVPEGQRGFPFLSQIEKRVVEANSAQEILLWTQVRGEIQRQDNFLIEQEHRRTLEKRQLLFKIGLSIGAVMVGTSLVVGGFSYVGLFVLGAGLYGLAPDYVKGFFRRRETGENR